MPTFRRSICTRNGWSTPVQLVEERLNTFGWDPPYPTPAFTLWPMTDLPCLSWSPQSELGHTPGGFEYNSYFLLPLYLHTFCRAYLFLSPFSSAHNWVKNPNIISFSKETRSTEIARSLPSGSWGLSTWGPIPYRCLSISYRTTIQFVGHNQCDAPTTLPFICNVWQLAELTSWLFGMFCSGVPFQLS